MPVILSLRDVPRTFSEETAMGGRSSRSGGGGMTPSCLPVATALAGTLTILYPV